MSRHVEPRCVVCGIPIREVTSVAYDSDPFVRCCSPTIGDECRDRWYAGFDYYLDEWADHG